MKSNTGVKDYQVLKCHKTKRISQLKPYSILQWKILYANGVTQNIVASMVGNTPHLGMIPFELSHSYWFTCTFFLFFFHCQGQESSQWSSLPIFRVNISPVVGISPCYRGRNGSLLSIGQKGRLLLVKMLKRKRK